MDEIKRWLMQLEGTASEIIKAFTGYVPYLLGALFLLLLGWVLAKGARRGATALASTLNRTVDRWMNGNRGTQVSLPTQTPKLVGDVVYWIIVLFFVTAAARTAHFDIISRWLEKVVSYIPTLIAGVVIVLVGYLVSALFRDVVSSAAKSAGYVQHRLFGTAAQFATFVTGFVIGLDQIGIDVAFLVTIIAITLSALLAGLSLAFGLGARTFADNLISARNMQRHYSPGQVVRLGDMQGEIIELTPTSMVVATEHGRTAIPARLFSEQASVLITPEDGDE